MNDLRIGQVLKKMGFLNPVKYKLGDVPDKKGSGSVKTLIEKQQEKRPRKKLRRRKKTKI